MNHHTYSNNDESWQKFQWQLFCCLSLWAKNGKIAQQIMFVDWLHNYPQKLKSTYFDFFKTLVLYPFKQTVRTVSKNCTFFRILPIVPFSPLFLMDHPGAE